MIAHRFHRFNGFFGGGKFYRSQILRFICENTGRWLSSSMWLLGVFADEFCYGYGEAGGA